MDHRGTPEFPGLVLTLVQDNPLDNNISVSSDRDTASGECIGIIYHVPEDLADGVIQELDYRERGGYSRHVVSVVLLQDIYDGTGMCTSKVGDTVQAIVYTAVEDNPNFFSPAVHNVGLGKSTTFIGRDVVTDIISCASGPSGLNFEYLSELAGFFRRGGNESNQCNDVVVSDEYLCALESRVRARMGKWRGMIDSSRCNSSDQAQAEGLVEKKFSENLEYSMSALSSVGGDCDVASLHVLYGWGSDETYQLQLCGDMADKQCVDMAVSLNRLTACLYSGIHSCVGSSSAQPRPLELHVPYSFDPLESSLAPTGSQPHPIGIHCGGIHTGVIFDTGNMYVWGGFHGLTKPAFHSSDGDDRRSTVVSVNGIVGAAFGHDHVMLLHTSGQLISLGSDRYGQCSHGDRSFVTHIPDGDLMQCLESAAGTMEEETGGVFEKNHMQWDRVHIHVRRWRNIPVCIRMVAVGVRHTVAVGDGGTGRATLIFSWGDNKHGQCITEVEGSAESHHMGTGTRQGASIKRTIECDYTKPWVLPTSSCFAGAADASVLSVACGVRHTVLIDSEHRVWSCGDNRYGSLGRHTPQDSRAVDFVLRPINSSTLIRGVRWVRAESGWSHVVIRGFLHARCNEILSNKYSASNSGEVGGYCDNIVQGWGRCDMGQLGMGKMHYTGDCVESNSNPCSSIKKLEEYLNSFLFSNAKTKKEINSGVNLGLSSPIELSQNGKGVLSPVLLLPLDEHEKSHSNPSSTPAESGGLGFVPQHIGEIWCGSEFTIAFHEHTHALYACGWNDHGNLSIHPRISGESSSSSDDPCDISISWSWSPMMKLKNNKKSQESNLFHDEKSVTKETDVDSNVYVQMKLANNYESNLSVGGSHCVCIGLIE